MPQFEEVPKSSLGQGVDAAPMAEGVYLFPREMKSR